MRRMIIIKSLFIILCFYCLCCNSIKPPKLSHSVSRRFCKGKGLPGDGCSAFCKCKNNLHCHPVQHMCFHSPRQTGEYCGKLHKKMKCAIGLKCSGICYPKPKTIADAYWKPEEEKWYTNAKYEQVTLAGSHNAGSYRLSLDKNKKANNLFKKFDNLLKNKLAKCLFENHDRSLYHQLKGGIRRLDIDFCKLDNTIYGCHGAAESAAIGDKLSFQLNAIRTFMLEQPKAVVTLYFSNVYNFDDPNSAKSDGINLPKWATEEINKLLDQFFCNNNQIGCIKRLPFKPLKETMGQLVERHQRIVYIVPGKSDLVGSWASTKTNSGYILRDSFIDFCGTVMKHKKENSGELKTLSRINAAMIVFAPSRLEKLNFGGKVKTLLKTVGDLSRCPLKRWSLEVASTLGYSLHGCLLKGIKSHQIASIDVDYAGSLSLPNLIRITKKMNKMTFERHLLDPANKQKKSSHNNSNNIKKTVIE